MATRAYNPVYATTTSDAIGYNERAGDNTVYNTFREIYANPTKATVDARELAKAKKAELAATIEGINAAQKNNLTDISAGARKTAQFNDMALNAARAAAEEEPVLHLNNPDQVPGRSGNLAHGPATGGAEAIFRREREQQRAAAHCPPAPVIHGCDTISRRLPDERISQHLPGYGGYVPTHHFLGNTYGVATARGIADIRALNTSNSKNNT